MFYGGHHLAFGTIVYAPYGVLYIVFLYFPQFKNIYLIEISLSRIP